MFTYNFYKIIIKYMFTLNVIFAFSEDKLCPEETRQHLNRCDMYFKCKDLIEKSTHVWIPEQCDEGLIYEHNLRICVLPNDDWKCQLEPKKHQQHQQQQQPKQQNQLSKHFQKSKANDNYHIVAQKIIDVQDKNEQVNSVIERSKLFLDEDSSEENENIYYINVGEDENYDDDNDNDDDDDDSHEGSGMNIEINDFINYMESKQRNDNKQDKKDLIKETKETSTNIDPKLTSQLQRLSQLIDGLKKTYQKQHNDQQELRPDQLNAFLAHFNIRNQYEMYNPYDELEEEELGEVQENDRMNLILAKPFNITKEQQPHNQLEAELKIFTNYAHNNKNNYMYDNSDEIITNQPDETVNFSIVPHDNSSSFDHSIYLDNIPKISKETLKTVLELSQQMIATQHIPHILGAHLPKSKTKPTVTNVIQPTVYEPNDTPFSHANYKQSLNNKYFYEDNQIKLYPSPLLSSAVHNVVHPTATLIHKHVYANLLPQQQQQQQQNHQHYFNIANGNDKIDRYGQLINSHSPLSNNHEADIQYNRFTSNNNGNYHMTIKPNVFFNTPAAITKYFTPSQHLDNHNINQHFPITDNFEKNTHIHQQQQQIISTDNYDTTAQYSKPYNQQDKMQQQSNHIVNYENYPYIEKLSSAVLDKDKKNYYETTSNPILNTVHHNIDVLNTDNKNSYFDTTSILNNNHNKYNHYVNSLINHHKNDKLPLITVASSYPSNADNTKLINIGGNFINFDIFQNAILPYLKPNALLENKIEIITCNGGNSVRHPNITDCTRYYVCSKKDNKVLSYSCPSYTAFNREKKMCDSGSYKNCRSDFSNYQENKYQGSNTINNSYETPKDNMLQMYIQQAMALASGTANQIITLNTSSTTTKPTSLQPFTRPNKVKKRKYYCKEGDKIPDQTSIHQYFICYKNDQGEMKGHKMICSNGLVFCPKTAMCTLTTKCFNN